MKNLPEGMLSFDFKVSSENHYDIATIEVNGDVVNTYSGNTDYISRSVSLTQNVNTVAFIYEKDDRNSQYHDTFYIRNIRYSAASPTPSPSPTPVNSTSSGGAVSLGIFILLLVGIGFRKESGK
ncbi:hypothetical protein P7F88_03455 [Vibrio hannami]|uniref:hypothetical protein n=1 Tax=Vibrio hannami TaxID=2717094 RepID=UPI00240F736A|nr:hypothetical protein [Vibrio hannami]MDG3085207.1 hypothetical protein [Vibrio hannami]